MMSLANLKQSQSIDFDKISHNALLIGASGYEARASYFFESRLGAKKSNLFKNKFVFTFDTETNNKSRIENDRVFAELGFKEILSSCESTSELDAVFNKYLSDSSGSAECCVVLDYSSMPRIWYGRVVSLIAKANISDVKVYFCYTPSKFVPPPDIRDQKYNRVVKPIRNYYALEFAEKPTALVIGLGYEANRALGLREHLDATKMYLFYTDKQSSDKYYDAVKGGNEHLIKSLKASNPQNIFEYSRSSLTDAFRLLSNLGRELLSDYEVVIAPCGPKFFTLVAFLAAIDVKGLSVWRISPTEYDPSTNREPTEDGQIECLQAKFVLDETVEVLSESAES